MNNLYNNFTKKIKLNTKTMLKFGSIASFAMLGIILFFGLDNIMLAFPIALIGIAFSFENIRVDTLKKVFILISLNVLLVSLSYISSKNLYLGFIINFITIFFIGYFLSFSYNPKLYKPVLMLFIFTSFSLNTYSAFLNRLLATLFGSILVIILSILCTKRKTPKNITKNLNSIFILLLKQIKLSALNQFDLDLYISINNKMQLNIYDIYISRKKNDLSSIISNLQFELFLHISYLNNLLYKDFKNDLMLQNKSFLVAISTIIDSLPSNLSLLYTDSLILFSTLKSNNTTNFSENFISVFNNMRSTLEKLKIYNKKTDITSKFSIIDFFNNSPYFKKSFYNKPIRLKFALRLSITLSLCLFISHIFNFSKVIWITITIMSVMQIYAEETILKGKGRIKGNIIGLIIFFLLTILHIKLIIFMTLFIALYLTYGFKEYYKLSIFTTLTSLSATFLYTDMSDILITRALLVLLGLFIVFITNKLLFPISIEDGVQVLLSKLLFFNRKLILNISSTNYNNNDIFECLLNIFLINRKLISRNNILKNNDIEYLILDNNITIIDISYSKLVR